MGHSLGAAIGSLVNVFDPELVVVGGGFGAAAGELILGPAREVARGEAIYPANRKLRLVAAELGAEAGLAGAGLVAFEALDGVR
jgi:glucokinase